MTTNLQKLIIELDECVGGSRGWVSLKKTDKEVKFEEKLELAELRGLTVEKHGRYGYVAFRK
uniref:Uncharacterized protein n=1 Tax=viral metagenome TaxID=1070528 RepID=A0A6C0JV43_9ZZZZ